MFHLDSLCILYIFLYFFIYVQCHLDLMVYHFTPVYHHRNNNKIDPEKSLEIPENKKTVG